MSGQEGSHAPRQLSTFGLTTQSVHEHIEPDAVLGHELAPVLDGGPKGPWRCAVCGKGWDRAMAARRLRGLRG